MEPEITRVNDLEKKKVQTFNSPFCHVEFEVRRKMSQNGNKLVEQ